MLGCFACPQALAGARNLTLGECQVGLGYEASSPLCGGFLGLLRVIYLT